MRDYKSLNIAGCGDFIASVSGSGTDFDLTLDDGTVLETYNPDHTGSLITGLDPAAGMLCLFGPITGARNVTVANCYVVPAAVAAILFRPADQT